MHRRPTIGRVKQDHAQFPKHALCGKLPAARPGVHCVLTQDALDRLQRPTLENGQRVSALRFGDPRVMGSSKRSAASRICHSASATATSAPRSTRSLVARTVPPR
jgi:hypothetical protein